MRCQPPSPSATVRSRVAITPDGKHAYVTNSARAGHGVGDHDRDGCGGSPHHHRHRCRRSGDHADGKHAYVTNLAHGTVSVITTATGAVSRPIVVGTSPTSVAFTPDGKHAYVTNRGNVADPADGTVCASSPPPRVRCRPPSRSAAVPSECRAPLTANTSTWSTPPSTPSSPTTWSATAPARCR